jgi:hypothetical protein
MERFALGQVRAVDSETRRERELRSPNSSLDLKSMLSSEGGLKKSGGNPLHNNMNAIAPMGCVANREDN